MNSNKNLWFIKGAGIPVLLGNDFLDEYDGVIRVRKRILETDRGNFDLSRVTGSILACTGNFDVTKENLHLIARVTEKQWVNRADESAMSKKLAELEKAFPLVKSDDERILALTKEFSDCTAYDGKPGKVNRFMHYAELIDPNVTISHRDRRMNPEIRKVLHQQVTEWLQNDVIEEATGRHNSCPVVVKKPDGGYRVCLDLKDLNQKLLRVTYPLFKAEECFERLAEAKYMTKIDMKEAFLQCPLDSACRDLLAFHVPGHGINKHKKYMFKRMPYGCNDLYE